MFDNFSTSTQQPLCEKRRLGFSSQQIQMLRHIRYVSYLRFLRTFRCTTSTSMIEMKSKCNTTSDYPLHCLPSVCKTWGQSHYCIISSIWWLSSFCYNHSHKLHYACRKRVSKSHTWCVFPQFLILELGSQICFPINVGNWTACLKKRAWKIRIFKFVTNMYMNKKICCIHTCDAHHRNHFHSKFLAQRRATKNDIYFVLAYENKILNVK